MIDAMPSLSSAFIVSIGRFMFFVFEFEALIDVT